jgi:hypothetical protein
MMVAIVPPQLLSVTVHGRTQKSFQTSMGPFFTLFPEPETAPEPSTPIDADGDSNGYCILA